MSKKTTPIPVKSFLADDFPAGMAVEKISSGDIHLLEEADYSHRHDYHLFLLLIEGTTSMEIDFKNYRMKKSSVLYIHPNQVHRVAKIENISAYILAITNEHINAEYTELLDEITPSRPLVLTENIFTVIGNAVSLCADILEKKYYQQVPSLLKDSFNTLIALIISQYLKNATPADKLSRFDRVTKQFKKSLEKNFVTIKSPSGYARLLKISTPYLNECVRQTTGFSVSYHIQQRIVLEAKRLLYHSDKSVKEIAALLGYNDYAYFSRLFTKVAGITALDFRKKNLD